jgi:signal transduction histidine kinase
MQTEHPSFALLLISGLLIFWLIPISSYLMLRGQRDRNAEIWFSGAWIYALVVTLFVFGAGLPRWLAGPVTQTLVVVSVLCFLEALRRELGNAPAPNRIYAGLALGDLLLLLGLQQLDLYLDWGRGFNLLLIGAIDLAVAGWALRVRQLKGGRALIIVAAVFLIFALVNLIRAGEVMITGHYAELRSFTWTANLGLLVNYLGGIFYCYGYWGFVIEKGRSKQEAAIEQAVLARERQRIAEETLTERNAMMEQVASMGRMAQSGALTASLSHEISQPLSTVLLNVQQALEVAGSPTPGRQDLQPLLELARDETLRAAHCLQQVKSMFRSGPPNRNLIRVNEVVRFVAAIMESHLRGAGISLNLDLAEADPVVFSAGELEHVLLNLLHNSIEAIKAAAPGPRRIEIRTWRNHGRLSMSVRDSGNGISESMAERIFDMQFSTRPDGMGMGLWLARFIMERHEGHIRLDPNATPGACFVLEFAPDPIA